LRGANAPSQPTTIFLTPSKIFLDIQIAHPKPTIKGIDITSKGRQQPTFLSFKLQTFTVLVSKLKERLKNKTHKEKDLNSAFEL